MKKQILPHICFIGCGNICGRHAKLLKKIFPSINLSFADIDETIAEKYNREYSGAQSFGSVDEAVCSREIDIVFITTPHAYHQAIGVTAAKEKKDIIIEKPVTRNLAELTLLEKAVYENSVRCTVAENYLYKPVLKKLSGYIAEGIIGVPLVIEINKSNRDKVIGWRRDPVMMGGGALLEGGVHWINFLVSIADSEPESVIAFRPEVKYETDIPFEDTISVNVRFKNGIHGKLFHSWRVPNRFFGMGLSKIYGTDGVITFESNGLYVSVWGRKNRMSFINPFKFLGFEDMLRSFIDDYTEGEEWKPGLKRIRSELGIIEAGYRSLESKRIEMVG